ncbi:MAG: DNA ligase [Gammaproteobacteria bacterium]|nr:DNA ligase [Gammaproteobacteria bacterium]
MHALYLLSIILFFAFNNAVSETLRMPELLLAENYNHNINLKEYWVSEKLDGVRALWNGQQLISRQGNIIYAPKWFIKVLPDISLDGELWSGRARFDELSGIVRRQKPADEDWGDIYYMVFDLPGSPLVFSQRLKQLKKIVSEIDVKQIQLIKQYRVASHTALHEKLEAMVAQGAEGLMLHAGSSLYKSGRHGDLMKLKKFDDAEAVVLKYFPGKGKYKGLMGSVLVENHDKKRFKIGTGFTVAERKNPPPIGSIITYKYSGLTKNGIPRFASYLRIRDDY